MISSNLSDFSILIISFFPWFISLSVSFNFILSQNYSLNLLIAVNLSEAS